MLLAALLAASLPALAAPAPNVVAENEHVRVLRARLAPGQTTPPHEHPPRVVVDLTDLKLEMTVNGKTQTIERKRGTVESIPATKHVVKNVSDAPFEAIEVELKAPTTERPLGDAAREDPEHTTLILEDDRVRVLRTRVAPGDTAPIHGHGERVTVILEGDRMRTTKEGGGPSESDVKTGDTSIGMPVRHSATNVGKIVHDAITIELKPAK